jgi:hypothetical protein
MEGVGPVDNFECHINKFGQVHILQHNSERDIVFLLVTVASVARLGELGDCLLLAVY